jgi:predicted nucleotidyltransferase component of viral defense system
MVYKEITGFNLGQIEKDYMQHLFLLNLYKKIKDELVFKGGTALQKNYGLNRFSEDLDFTMMTKINLDSVLKSVTTNMSAFGCETSEKKIKKDESGSNYLIKIKGPLYDGNEISHTYIRLDISEREDVLTPIETNTIAPIYRDLPPYTASVMSPSEIMAEKIRAILTRNSARDIYDLWFLARKKTKVSISLINSKLKYYKKTFDLDDFKKATENKKRIWVQELEQLVPVLLDFEEIKEELFSQQFIKS